MTGAPYCAIRSDSRSRQHRKLCNAAGVFTLGPRGYSSQSRLLRTLPMRTHRHRSYWIEGNYIKDAAIRAELFYARLAHDGVKSMAPGVLWTSWQRLATKPSQRIRTLHAFVRLSAGRKTKRDAALQFAECWPKNSLAHCGSGCDDLRLRHRVGEPDGPRGNRLPTAAGVGRYSGSTSSTMDCGQRAQTGRLIAPLQFTTRNKAPSALFRFAQLL